jgi:3-dehydroquinate synthase
VQLLQRAGLPVELPAVDREAFQEALGHDKKIARGQLRMVLPEAIGRVQIVPVSLEEITHLIMEESEWRAGGGWGIF